MDDGRPPTVLSTLYQEHPATFGVVAGLGALVIYLCVMLVWSTLGVAAAFGQSLVFGIVVGGLCYLQSRMHHRSP